jgi:hypothetical protein
MDLGALLLLVAVRHRVGGSDAEAGLARFRAIVGADVGGAALHDAVAAAVAAGDLHDPVRITPGALQCSWQLEPTPQGARKVADRLAQEKTGADALIARILLD